MWWPCPTADGPFTASCTRSSIVHFRRRPVHVFDTPHGCRVGVLICYDNNISQTRVTALLGAEILLALIRLVAATRISPRE
jgi:predicted amidohydrolase